MTASRTNYTTSNPDYLAVVQSSFSRQQVMATLGARLAHVGPGEAVIELPFAPAWTQQHGYLHAGIVTTIVDSACGYAAYSLMPEGSSVLTVEFKVNLLSPAKGDLFRAVGRVFKAGNTLTFCEGEAIAIEQGREKVVATMMATMMCLRGREDS